MKRIKLFYIGHRVSPQSDYYVKLGQLSKAAAKRRSKPLYGEMLLTGFESSETYEAEIKKLEDSGIRFV